ncbi:MAG: hypothetical protein H0T69_08885 [Thermoleophilaceae bacterium]|nr:hypothetical protein [Thermoleophilaceae bacterium]
MRRRLTLCTPALPAAAAAEPYLAPGNKVLWGGQGGYTAGSIGAFTQQSGKRPAVFNYFIDWRGDFNWLGQRLEDAARQNSNAMLSVSTEQTGSRCATSRAAAVTASWSASTACSPSTTRSSTCALCPR